MYICNKLFVSTPYTKFIYHSCLTYRNGSKNIFTIMTVHELGTAKRTIHEGRRYKRK